MAEDLLYRSMALDDVPAKNPVGLSVTDLTCGYGKSPIIAGFDFQARSRELTALVGPNG